MRSLASVRGSNPKRDQAAKEKLREAYVTVFSGESGQIVLADLAEYCGYYKVFDPAISMSVMADHNARRAVFGRIFHFLNLSEDERRELHEAARREYLANIDEGQSL